MGRTTTVAVLCPPFTKGPQRPPKSNEIKGRCRPVSFSRPVATRTQKDAHHLANNKNQMLPAVELRDLCSNLDFFLSVSRTGAVRRAFPIILIFSARPLSQRVFVRKRRPLYKWAIICVTRGRRGPSRGGCPRRPGSQALP